MERHVESQESTGKKRLILEASMKILQGEKLIQEGNLELDNLLGSHSLRKSSKKKSSGGGSKLTAGQKSALTKKRLIKERDSTFRKDTRSDEKVMEGMIQLVRKNTQVSTDLFKKKLRIGERRLNKLLGQLVGAGKIEDHSSGEEGARHKWMLPSKSVKEQKAINGHPIKGKKSEGGGGSGRGFQIDVTSDEYVKPALELMKTDDWVTNGKLIETIDVSAGVVNRLTTHMKKKKLIKQVTKNHNPAHKHSPKNYERPLTYWVAV